MRWESDFSPACVQDRPIVRSKSAALSSVPDGEAQSSAACAVARSGGIECSALDIPRFVVDRAVSLGYCGWMHVLRKPIVAFLFVAAIGCGGSTPNAKSGADAGAGDGGDGDSKQAECSVVEKKFGQIDDAVKDVKGLAAGRALVPALEKMSKEFKEAPLKTPGLDKATAELVTEADSFVTKMKELNVVFTEMEQINKTLESWQTKVEKVAEEFDVACNKAPKDECEAMSKRVTKIPHLEGDAFAQYAGELDRFVRATGEYEVLNPGLKTALKNMLSVLGEAVKPMLRLSELLEQPQKLDPAAGQLKAKFNRVREMCGLPVRK